jgi:tartrate-resistant acid phosphatase type 5
MRRKVVECCILFFLPLSFLSQENNSVQPVFAVIGDYGFSGANEAAVASLVASWNPDFIITTGDNNYPSGQASTIDANIGKYYHSFIHPYTGAFGSGAAANRFFPSLGNHDLLTSSGQPYFNYFSLPGNERYYDFVKGDIHFFVLNSDPSEPDGTNSTSVQAQWLRNKLAVSQSKWNIVYFHHSPFASDAVHGDAPWMQWPFKSWGASVVLSGHSHIYERIIRNDFLYIINGLGGRSIYSLVDNPVAGSMVRYNKNYGALKISVKEDTLKFSFFNIEHDLVDTYSLVKPPDVGIENPEQAQVSLGIFPNPNEGEFSFGFCRNENTAAAEINYEVVNLTGQVILKKKLIAGTNCFTEQVSLPEESQEGFYFLKLACPEFTVTKKIVVTK